MKINTQITEFWKGYLQHVNESLHSSCSDKCFWLPQQKQNTLKYATKSYESRVGILDTMEFTLERTDISSGGAVAGFLDLDAKLCYLEVAREVVCFCGPALGMFIVQTMCNSCRCI